MAVVTKYGSGAKDPASDKNQDSIYSGGRLRELASLVTVTNGDSIASIFEFGEIPTNAIIDGGLSMLDNGAATGAAGNLGFYTPKGGAAIGTIVGTGAQLAAAVSIAAAANQSLRTIGTLTLANSNKRVWELAGYTSDPGGNLSVCLTLTAGATATAATALRLVYSVN
jgi:hypothetical protein